MKRLFTILLAVLSLLSLTACGGSPTEETSQEPLVDIQPQEPEAPPEPTPEELAAQEVEDLLASLTLEEKVRQPAPDCWGYLPRHQPRSPAAGRRTASSPPPWAALP